MKEYHKPSCVSHENVHGFVPLAALGMEAVAALSVGGAALIGVAAGLSSSKGGRDYLPVKKRVIQEQIVF